MAIVISEATPTLTCICGMRRNFPTQIGLPPIGMESFCPGADGSCGKLWRLVSISTDHVTGIQSWTWADFPEEAKVIDIKAANALARTLRGIDAALSEFAFRGPARGMA